MIVTIKLEVEGLGDRIRELRKSQGLRQDDLRRILYVSESYISKIETEKEGVGIPYNSLLNLLSLLEIPTDAIEKTKIQFEEELKDLIFENR